jgi:hypothetical protein
MSISISQDSASNYTVWITCKDVMFNIINKNANPFQVPYGAKTSFEVVDPKHKKSYFKGTIEDCKKFAKKEASKLVKKTSVLDFNNAINTYHS